MRHFSHIAIGLLAFLALPGLDSGSVLAATAGNGSASFPAAAGPAQANPHLITCWFDETETYRGAQDAKPGTAAGGPIQVGKSGDHTWAYTFAAPDGTSCPQPYLRGVRHGPHLVTCWYSTDKKFTRATDAKPYDRAGGPFNTGHSGPYDPGHGQYSWAYTIAAADGKSCPKPDMPPSVDPNVVHLINTPDEDQPQPHYITCWYNADKKYKGADDADPGLSPGMPVQTGKGGDQAWAYTIAGPATSCPRPDMPASAKPAASAPAAGKK